MGILQDILGNRVASVRAFGEPALLGDVVLKAGANVTLAQSGQEITIAATGGGGGGVTSVKALGQSAITGAAVFKPGAGIALSQTGQEITIAATGGLALGGAPPAIAAAPAAGSTGLAADAGHTHAGLGSIKVFAQPALLGDAVLKPGAGISMSQTGQEMTILNNAPAPVPGGESDASRVVVANLAGTALALASTLWLAAARLNSAGQAANDVFGTAPVQSTGDATNGQAFGARVNGAGTGAGARAAYSVFESTGASRGQFAYDQAFDRVIIRGDTRSVVVATDAAETKISARFEGNSFNVGVCGASAYGSGEGVFALGNGTTPPASNSGTFAALFNSAGTFRQYAGQTFSFYPGGTTERMRLTTPELSVATTNVALFQIGGSFGGGVNVVWQRNATTNPTTNPTNGFIGYGSGGEPLWRTSGGAIRCAVTVGAAVASGLFVAASSGGSPTRELKKRLLTFSDGASFEALDFAA